MATSTVALGKVEISQRRGKDIPNTWGVDSEGFDLQTIDVCFSICLTQTFLSQVFR